MNDNAKQLPVFISSLLHPDVYDHVAENIQLIETHISWVILTGPFAYKIKKPVNLGFLDFSTLEKRHFYCAEELRLNTRLAAAIYLDVIPITISEELVVFCGSGRVIDYAIKMVQFPQEMQLDRMLANGMLQTEHIDALANMVAEFHQHTDVANKDDIYGTPEQIYRPIKENFIQLQQLLSDDTAIAQLTVLESWSQATFAHLKLLLTQRKRDGFIRECHGDLHLRNLVFINEQPVAFDCIEFDPELRWIDIISDLAFLIMDLQDRQQYNYAQRLLNFYLEKTGDYAATQILVFYLVYRAMVRAKVEAISSSQMASTSQVEHEANMACYGYLELAQSYLQARKPMLIITCGMSASGKSTLTQPLVEKLAAIRIRSDIERKRLFKIASESDSSASFNAGIYSTEATQQTYQHLTKLAELVLNASYPVIIDATCLKYEQRELFRQVASRKNVPFVIVEFIAQPNTLRQRINARAKEASDADQSILEQQLFNWQPLHKNELFHAITIDTESPTAIDSLFSRIKLYYKGNK
jgi:aminoglycoside phosphotransferase family enzyme/predicted kinase